MRRVLQPSTIRCLDLALENYQHPASLLDVGCGQGVTIEHARGLGIQAIGVDLAVPVQDSRGWFYHHDLRTPLDLGVSFDWVLCWEVAEHLEPEADETLCDTVARHLKRPSGRLFFTAAVPGQRGPGHINCRPTAFWRGLFEVRGLSCLTGESSILGPLWLTGAPRAPWYGRNLQIFGWA